MHMLLTDVLPYALAVLGYLWHKRTVSRQLTRHRKQEMLILNAHLNDFKLLARKASINGD